MNAQEIDDFIESKRKSAIGLLRTPLQTDAGTPGCWFGGQPTLPPDIDWPMVNSNTLVDGLPVEGDPGIEIPMHFFAQINLSLMPDMPGLPEMPREGTLFVFYDPVLGFSVHGDGVAQFNGKGVRLIHVRQNVSTFPLRTPPPMPDLTPLDELETVCTEYSGTTEFLRWPIRFHVVDTWPAFSRDPDMEAYSYDPPEGVCARLDGLSEAQRKAVDEASGGRRYWKNNKHYVVLQTMFGASQANAFPSSPSTSHPQTKLTKDYVLLMTLAPDGEIGHNFWDTHHFGLWIRRDDLAAGNFDKIYVGWEL